jgi:FlaA1/EpsC-like NDP-sugar epimerase
VGLVLHASARAQAGEICILKMGDPLLIVDLAKKVAQTMGRSPEDCPMVFTGLRPGEKMSEELYYQGDEIATDHPDVLLISKTETVDTELLENAIQDLLISAKQDSVNCRQMLFDLVENRATRPARINAA